jgi:hypothetical protein
MGGTLWSTWASTVQSLDVLTGRMTTWTANEQGRVVQPRPGGPREPETEPVADPHWVSDRSMLFVTSHALVPEDTNGVEDIVLKTRR